MSRFIATEIKQHKLDKMKLSQRLQNIKKERQKDLFRLAANDNPRKPFKRSFKGAYRGPEFFLSSNNAGGIPTGALRGKPGKQVWTGNLLHIQRQDRVSNPGYIGAK